MVRPRRICVLAMVLGLTLCAAAQQPQPAPRAPEPPPRADRQVAPATERSDAASAGLPDAPSAVVANQPQKRKSIPTLADPYFPLSGHEKFDRWSKHTYSPYTLSSVLISATWSQMTGAWHSYGGGMEGFGKRFGASLADTEVRGFFGVFLLPTLLHQDPRYFAKRRGGIIPRMWYAGSRVLVTRDDDGDNTFNTSEVLATFLTRSLSNAYYPERDRGFGETMNSAAGALLSDAGSNVLREFWPDISRIFKKYEPEKLKKMQQKLPAPVQKIGSPGNE